LLDANFIVFGIGAFAKSPEKLQLALTRWYKLLHNNKSTLVAQEYAAPHFPTHGSDFEGVSKFAESDHDAQVCSPMNVDAFLASKQAYRLLIPNAFFEERSVPILRVFNISTSAHKQHAKGTRTETLDCRHFCDPSPVMDVRVQMLYNLFLVVHKANWTGLDEQDLPREPNFVFVHVEKTAGSFLEKLFQNSVPTNYHYWHSGWDYVGSADSISVPRVPDEYFIVSSYRNPCAHAVSWWSYCCEKAWAKKFIPRMGRWGCGEHLLDRGLCPSFNFKDKVVRREQIQISWPNVEGFLSQLLDAAGAYEKVFNLTFKLIGPDRVNCWVEVENIDADMLKCLRKYQQQTGNPVDYTKVKKRVFHNAGVHDQCHKYYTPESEKLVRRQNAFLYKYFSFNTCCAG